MEPNTLSTFNTPVTPIIKVTFNPLRDVPPGTFPRASGRVTFDSNEAITFRSTEGTVKYTLEVNTALQVVFPSNPIQWVEKVGGELTPIDPPDGAMVSRSNNGITVKFTANQGPATTFRYYVIVQTLEGENGRFFGSDPTIVIMHPDS